jgi:hypothetical protein
MVCDVAAAINPMYFNTPFAQFFGAPKQILLLTAASEGERVGVLKKKQGWGAISSGDFFSKLFLKVARLIVRNEA